MIARIFRPRNGAGWLLGLVLPLHLSAQAVGALTGTIVGQDAAPLAHARIRLVGTRPTVLSDSNGRFRLPGAPVGDRVVEVQLIGYVEVLQPVQVAEGQTVDLHIVLSIVPVPLNPIEVTGERALLPEMRGFEARRARGQGHFFNREEIGRMQPRVLTDVLRRVPGVIVQSGGGSFGGTDESVRMSRTIGVNGLRQCPVLYFINGLPFTVTSDLSINQYVVPEDVIGIEVYSGTSQLPPQFQSGLLNSRCGVIVIWTRLGNEDDRPGRAPPDSSEGVAHACHADPRALLRWLRHGSAS